jgi:signal transduction histidine kinase/CheY-like chemotaxis protein
MDPLYEYNIESFLFECISDSLIVLDTDSRVIHANETAEVLFSLGKPDAYRGSSLLKYLDGETAQFVGEKLTKAIKQKQAVYYDLFLELHGGRWFDVRLYPSADRAVLLLRDITAKKQVEEKIDLQNKKLLLLSEAANHILVSQEPGELLDALFMELTRYLDLDVYINYMFNEKTNRLELMYHHGIKETDAEDLRYLDLGIAVCGEVARDCVRIVEEHIEESERPRTQLVREMGIKAYASYPLISGGKMLGTLSFGTRSRVCFSEEELELLDTICTQVAAMFERTLLIMELTKKKEEAEAANSVKNNFLSMMSHELRTPLNSIIGFSQVLLDDLAEPLTYRQNQKVSKVLKSSRHLLNLINDLLELVKSGSDADDIKRVSLPVESIVNDSLRIIQPQGKAKGIRIYDRTQACSHIHVLANATKVNQVMLNLLENAIKYTPAGGKVSISCSVEGKELRLSISDNGEGIPDHEQKKIFDPFYRIFNLESNIEGTGIGLTLVKQLVQQMGGRIGVESAHGYGSSFWFSLPIDSQKVSYGFKTDQQSNVALNLDGMDGKILYIDDNQDDLALLEAIFESQSAVQFITVLTGNEGLERMTEPASPNLILLDIHLADIHGFDVLDKLKKDPVTREIPIIAISADTSVETRARAKELGINEYLTKPLDLKELLLNIRNYL